MSLVCLGKRLNLKPVICHLGELNPRHADFQPVGFVLWPYIRLHIIVNTMGGLSYGYIWLCVAFNLLVDPLLLVELINPVLSRGDTA